MNGLEFKYTELGVCIWDGVLIYRMGCFYMGWVLVNGMECYFPG